MNNILEISCVNKYFAQGENKITILKDASLIIKSNQFVTLLGESGCGKSTLLQILGLLDTPSSGVLKICGSVVGDISDRSRTLIRLNKLGFVYQSHNLMGEFTALENVAIPLFLQGKSSKVSYGSAEEILIELGLQERLNHKPSSLSGGEMQRVAIARAIVHSPDLILADEPTGNLDPDNANKVFSMFHKVIKKRGLSALVVTHNHNLAQYSDRIITIQDRQIKELQK